MLKMLWDAVEQLKLALDDSIENATIKDLEQLCMLTHDVLWYGHSLEGLILSLKEQKENDK